MLKKYIRKIATVCLVILAASGVRAGTDVNMPPEIYREELLQLIGYGTGVVDALKGTGKVGATRKEPNIHIQNVFDEIFSESLPGIEITWLRSGADPKRVFLHSLSISRGSPSISKELGIGQRSEKKILEGYGTPTERHIGTLRYNVKTQFNQDGDTVSFYFRDGTLERVEWKWWIE